MVLVSAADALKAGSGVHRYVGSWSWSSLTNTQRTVLVARQTVSIGPRHLTRLALAYAQGANLVISKAISITPAIFIQCTLTHTDGANFGSDHTVPVVPRTFGHLSLTDAERSRLSTFHAVAVHPVSLVLGVLGYAQWCCLRAFVHIPPLHLLNFSAYIQIVSIM